MCGIMGILDWSGKYSREIFESKIASSLNLLNHRGPNDSGIELDECDGGIIGFGHKRLSIMDLSSSGRQPMVSICGRYIICFNGEIYNHADLRREVEKVTSNYLWRGHSDTESLLASFSMFGINHTIEKISGMFAIAIWDRYTKKLTLIRDRMGEKPIYYGLFGKKFIFGSEISVFSKILERQLEINTNSVSDLMRFGYIPDPKSIYKNINKLPAASLLNFSLGGNLDDVKIEGYWSVLSTGNESSNFNVTSESEAIDRLNLLIESSVKEQMISDVPLGCFLSGGIDSSLIASVMQNNSSSPIKTFSIGFENADFNEAPNAKRIANYIGSNHNELYVTPHDMLDVVNKLPYIYSEPFADSSQIPTYIVSNLAKTKISVALSGDGGDELFGGYSHYKNLPKVWSIIEKIPYRLRGKLSKIDLSSTFPAKYHNFIKCIDATDIFELYLKYSSKWEKPNELLLNKSMVNDIDPRRNLSRSFFPQQGMMDIDISSYLVGDILVKVDRASMSNSLETRIPLLNRRIVEFSNNLPLKMKINSGVSKWILRQVLYKYVPKELVEMPKRGFSVPLAEWLRGPLRDWSESLLNKNLIDEQGFFDSRVVSKAWFDHLKGTKDNSAKLWNVLMFQSWLACENTK